MYCLYYGIVLNKEILGRHGCIERCCRLLKPYTGKKIRMRGKTQIKQKTRNYKKWKYLKKGELRNLKKEIEKKKKIDFGFWNNLSRY